MISADPVHTAAICGVAVRFFAAPSGRAEVPWHSIEELYRAARLPRHQRRELLQRTRTFPGGEFATIATQDGPLLIESHCMAIGLVGALIDAGMVPPSFADAYAAAGEAVLRAMHADLPPAERFHRLKAMAKETLGADLVLPQ